MKRVIAILVVFALVAGAAFAEINFGGSFGYKSDFLNGKSENDGSTTKGYDIGSSLGVVSATLDLNFSGDNYGGRVRLYANPARAYGTNGTPAWSGGPYWVGAPFAFAWWKPIEQFKIQLGNNPDGDWGTAAITGWGFNASAQDYVAIDNDSTYFQGYTGDTFNNTFNNYFAIWKVARAVGFYGGFKNGLGLSVTPIDMIALNIGIPFGGDDGTSKADGDGPTYDVFRKLHVNAVFNLEGIGKATLSWQGRSSYPGIDQSPGSLYASFNLTAIENLGVDLGVGFDLPYTDSTSEHVTYAVRAPSNGEIVGDGISIGLGVTYSAGDLGVKFRFGTLILPEDTEVDTDGYTMMGFGLLPYYSFGAVKAYLGLGMGIGVSEDKDDKSSYVDWYVNPYIQVPAGGLTFWAGFKLEGASYKPTTGNSQSIVVWSVPIGISVGF